MEYLVRGSIIDFRYCIDTIASILKSLGSPGPRLLPVPGEIITEIEAISILSCAKAMRVSLIPCFLAVHIL
ncbi:MAG: hypothetical protein K8R25_10535 [Methanosarcinales archaeon]|nr:hypothetical protein [Methanosarcinales archaeon]